MRRKTHSPLRLVASLGSAALVGGAVVEDAWLPLNDARAFYAKVELED